ncbi:MAG: hypothetical protein ACI9VM_000255 [Candidatus Azotimanducaceae bacterium]|jgi:hypothetical protein
MPTIAVKSQPDKDYDAILDALADHLPSIAAPLMNIDGSALHEGGVGEAEILVEFTEFSPRDRNVNNIQITMVAHAFPQRVDEVEKSTEQLKQGVMEVLRDFDRNLVVGISIWLVEMGYTTIGKED